MTMYPGAGPQRRERSSRLMFHWRSSDGSFDAISGQKGLFNIYGVANQPGYVSDLYNDATKVGSGMARWDQAPARGSKIRLALEGEVAGQDSENLYFPNWMHKVQPVTLYWKFWTMYTLGSNVAGGPWYGPMLGITKTSGGGVLGFYRSGTAWNLWRYKGAAGVTSSVTELASHVPPFEFLGTLDGTGLIQLTMRDASNATLQGATAGGSTYVTPTDIWGGQQLVLNGVQGLVAPGGRHYHEVFKVARGVKTFDQMALLS